MQLPTLPTDSFYKFLSLTGVVLAISSAYIFVSKIYEYRDAIPQHQAEMDFLGPLMFKGYVSGCVLTIVGFICWYFQIQRPLDRLAHAKAELALLQLAEAKLKFSLTQLQIENEKRLLQSNSTLIASSKTSGLGDLGDDPIEIGDAIKFTAQ